MQVPDLALVRFVVEDHDHRAKNDFVGQFTLPFTSLRTGARARTHTHMHTFISLWHYCLHCGLLHSDNYNPSFQGIDMFTY